MKKDDIILKDIIWWKNWDKSENILLKQKKLHYKNIVYTLKNNIYLIKIYYEEKNYYFCFGSINFN